MKGFLADLYLRRSCYNCQYKGNYSLADITLGDFWGINIICPEFDDDEGVSLVLIRSEKGKELLQKISTNLIIKEFKYEEAARFNPSLDKSSDKWENREKFYKGWRKEEINKLIDRLVNGD